MNTPLFPLLWLLTLLDLAFVQATGILGGTDLLPLWALAGAAFALRRLQRFTLYRVAWNVGTVAVFALLVHHATTSGLLHMLEDGLVLAVLCQVHLLNNVGDRQRPDLVFFNTFLITFVTSFFSAGAAWSLLFAAHAFALVPALQLHSLLGRAAPDGVTPAAVRALLRGSVPTTAGIVAITALVFVAWPRDFRRQGWLGDAWHAHGSAGLAERVRLDDDRTTRLGEEIVARFTACDSDGSAMPTHWRAIAFARFEDGAWTPQDVSAAEERLAVDLPWHRDAEGTFHRGEALPQAGTRVRVELLGGDRFRLPIPLTATLLQPRSAPGAHLEPTVFGGFVARRTHGAPGSLVYEVATAPGAPSLRISARTRRHFTQLPDQQLPDSLHALATQLLADPAVADTPLERATATTAWLEQHRRYQLPGGPGFARNLGEFLLGSGAGHCEYFATALALLLRAQDVPCRLVGGYLVTEAEASAAVRIARSKHAHAWVEVLDERGAWHTFDATPAASVLAATETGDDASGGLWNTLQRWWASVTGFDQTARERWLAAIDPRTPTGAGLLAALALLAFLSYLRRRSVVLPEIRALHRALRGARLSLLPGETPRELLARATRDHLDPIRLDRLRQAVSAHERARYAPCLADSP